MRFIKINFAILNKYSILLIESSIESKKLSKEENNLQLSDINLVKQIIKRSIAKWLNSEEGKQAKQNFEKENTIINLQTLNEMLSDEYFRKYKTLREIIKNYGFLKLRIREFPLTSDWNIKEPLNDLNEDEFEDQVNSLAELL